jgi:hypothetical protein
MQNIKPLLPEENNQQQNRAQREKGVEASSYWNGFNPITCGAQTLDILSRRTDRSDAPAIPLHSINQRKEKLLERKIDRTQLANL